MKIYCTFKP